MESKGIVFKIWLKPEYGMMAWQMAMSLKWRSPLIPIHLITDHVAVSKLRSLTFFDTVIYTDTPTDPAQAKIDLYESLPFDHNIFLDADGLCVSEIDSTFEQLIGSNKPFQCFVHAWYNRNDLPVMPLMVWANRDVIWDHYKLDNELLPATQSSFLYIRKGEVCKEIYTRMQTNYANRIPLENLRNKWGGGQPDELYLNVTLAQLGYDPTCANIIYFADNRTLAPHQIKNEYKILSLFGTAGNVKPILERFYDKEVVGISQQIGGGVTYKWKNIKNSKHANTMQQPLNRRSAFRGKFIRAEKLSQAPQINKTAKTHLFTSFFDSGSPARQRELLQCLRSNLANKYIDSVTVLSQVSLDTIDPKLKVITSERPTYQMMINQANKVSSDNDVVIISNSDIYFDDTILWPHGVNMNATMLALSRWDVASNGAKRLFANEHSQDTWVFKGKINVIGADYFFGVPGCDNRFAHDVERMGYRVKNTAKDIICHHLHNTNVRAYTQKDRLQGDYLPVYISSVRDLSTNKLLIQQPGKVGDILICAPIAKWYADKGYEVYWECPSQYHSLFKHFDYVTPVEKALGQYEKTIDISFGLNPKSHTNIIWHKRRESESFVTVKYDLAGVPVSERHNLVYQRNINNENELYQTLGLSPGCDYILVHDSSDYGTPIHVDSELKIIKFAPVDNYTIFDWRKVIENAKEIHCIDSSLANFVEVINTSADKYFYRVKERTTESIFNFNKWNLIIPTETICH